MLESDRGQQMLEPLSPADLLDELERNRPEVIRKQRAHQRVRIKVKVIIRPGNTSDQSKLKIQGMTGDISEGGCCVLSPLPLGVGDVYRLEFEPSVVGVPIVFARCLRCRLVREDAFEVGFAFFRPVPLADAGEQQVR